MISSFADVIDQLGGIGEFADGVGMTYGAAKKARSRKSLSARYFAPTVALAKAKGQPITLETLVGLSAGR